MSEVAETATERIGAVRDTGWPYLIEAPLNPERAVDGRSSINIEKKRIARCSADDHEYVLSCSILGTSHQTFRFPIT